MRALLIINPGSGDEISNEEKVPRIREWLGRANIDLDLEYTREDRPAGGIVREALARRVEAVIVGGGDGTVGEAARELMHTGIPLGILPIGTFNNMARSLGIRDDDLEAACEVIAKGHTREIDVGLADGRGFFLEAAGAGLDAALFPMGEEIKGGKWSRIFSALKLALQFRAEPIVITFDRPAAEAAGAGMGARRKKRLKDKRTIRRFALMAVAANGPYYGGGFTVAPAARLGDGLLTLTVYRRFSKLELALHFWSISRGRYRYSPKMEAYHAAEITLESPRPLPVHVDGQPSGELPVTLKSIPRALRVFAPAL